MMDEIIVVHITLSLHTNHMVHRVIISHYHFDSNIDR
jgi:hypothetical protein